MYALVKNNKIVKYPYSLGEFRQDNPQISLPENVTAQLLAEIGLVKVEDEFTPTFDSQLQYLDEGLPKKNSNGNWVRTFTVRNYTEQQIAERIAERSQTSNWQRAHAYREEADPLFFMAQRGDATMEQWLAKVEEIKQRYPK